MNFVGLPVTGFYRRRPIGEMIEPVATLNPASLNEESTFNYIDLSAIDQENKVISGARSVRATEAPSRARQLVRAGDILVSTVRPNLNGVARVRMAHDGHIASTGFCVLRPRQDKLNADFLFHWVKSWDFIDAMVRSATGASYPAVSDAIVRSSLLPVPPVLEQRRIAAILDQADALRAKRRATMAQLRDLSRAAFLEMFGDPLGNPKGWRKSHIGTIARVVTGNTPAREVDEYYGRDIEWIKSDNINTGAYYATSATERLSRSGRAVARTAPAGSILVTCIAGSPGSVGNAAMLDRAAAFNQQINAVVPEGCNPHFLYAQIRVGKRMVQEMSTEGMKGLVSKSRFERIKVMLPPSAMQEAFAERALLIERTRQMSGVAFEATNALFASLQHRAFRGEL